MSTIFALLLVVVALAATLYPLRRSGRLRLPRREARVAELEERYRSALADLQDVELDRQVGNLIEADYAALRLRYRMRAAQVLAELDAEREARIRAEVLVGRPSNGHDTDAAVHDAVQATQGRSDSSRAPAPLSRALVPAAALIVAAIFGIGLLYTRSAQSQSQQDVLAVLPIGHAHGITVAADGFWVAHHDGLLHSSTGEQWQPSIGRDDWMGIVESPGGGWLAMGHDVLRLSRDGGRTWSAAAHDLPGTDIHGAQRLGTRLYSYVVGWGLFRSEDGLSWEHWAPPVAGNVYGMAVLPGAPDVVFLASSDRLIRSVDGGRTWSEASGAGNLALRGAVRGVAADVTRDTLYAATSDGLYQSRVRGSQWIKLPPRSGLMAVGASDGTVAILNERNEFLLSRDGGVSWAR